MHTHTRTPNTRTLHTPAGYYVNNNNNNNNNLYLFLFITCTCTSCTCTRKEKEINKEKEKRMKKLLKYLFIAYLMSLGYKTFTEPDESTKIVNHAAAAQISMIRNGE